MHSHFRRLARANRQKLGSPRIEPQLGKDPDDVDVLDDLERALGGDGGAFAALPGALKPFCCGKLNTS